MDVRLTREGASLILAFLLVMAMPWSSGDGLSTLNGASISGTVFVDRDCNGTKEPGEPALAGWKVLLRGQPQGLPVVLDSTTTTSDGTYIFAGLMAGDYSVSSSQSAEYVQHTPTSVDYRESLSSSQTTTGRDFSFKAVATCDTTVHVSCQGGVFDDFSSANGPEGSSPSAGLLAEMNTCASAVPFFDQPISNGCFGHTFSNCWGTCAPVTAVFTIKMRASAAGSQSDVLEFGHWPSPGSIWQASLSTLLEIKTGGADVSWDPGDTMTLTLDLADLPIADRGVTNIMAALYTGDLDLLIRGNTEVDGAGGECGGG